MDRRVVLGRVDVERRPRSAPIVDRRPARPLRPGGGERQPPATRPCQRADPASAENRRANATGSARRRSGRPPAASPPREQRSHRLRRHARLVAEHEHEHLAARATRRAPPRSTTSSPRRRAAVDHDLRATEELDPAERHLQPEQGSCRAPRDPLAASVVPSPARPRAAAAAAGAARGAGHRRGRARPGSRPGRGGRERPPTSGTSAASSLIPCAIAPR